MRPNLLGAEIKVNNIRSEMNNNKWSDLQYKQILLSDSYFNFMDSQKKKKKKKTIQSHIHAYFITTSLKK